MNPGQGLRQPGHGAQAKGQGQGQGGSVRKGLPSILTGLGNAMVGSSSSSGGSGTGTGQGLGQGQGQGQGSASTVAVTSTPSSPISAGWRAEGSPMSSKWRSGSGNHGSNEAHATALSRMGSESSAGPLGAGVEEEAGSCSAAWIPAKPLSLLRQLVSDTKDGRLCPSLPCLVRA